MAPKSFKIKRFALPQDEGDKSGRAKELEVFKKQYPFTKNPKYPFPLTDYAEDKYKFKAEGVDQVLPSTFAKDELEKSGITWRLKLLRTLIAIRENTEAMLADKDLNLRFNKQLKFWDAPQWLKAVQGKTSVILEHLNPDFGAELPPARDRTEENYQAMFRGSRKDNNVKPQQRVRNEVKAAIGDGMPELPAPILENFKTDEGFGYSYLCGPSPCMLSKFTQDDFNKLDGAYRDGMWPALVRSLPKTPGFVGETPDKLMAEGRLYYVDYRELNLPISAYGKHPNGKQKYGYGPFGFFGVSKNAKVKQKMLPIGIRVGPENDDAFFTPPSQVSAQGTDPKWMLAKFILNSAHNTYHEVVSHLVETHLVMETVVNLFRRNVSIRHPLYPLMSHHFEGTLPINALAVTELITEGKAVERLTAGTEATNLKVIEKYRLGFDFRGKMLPQRLINQGLTEDELDIEYPFRDDGLLVWKATKDFVAEYVESIYGEGSERVLADTEVNGWLNDLADPTEGRMKNFFKNGSKLSGKVELVEILTMFIFTGGPNHAAVNFPQRSDMMYVPAAPFAGYRPAPKQEIADKITEADLIAFMPPLDVALQQMNTTFLLGSVFYTEFGKYKLDAFKAQQGDPGRMKKLEKMFEDFEENLKKVEEKIHKRNRNNPGRLYSYDHLRPSRIPQSINI